MDMDDENPQNPTPGPVFRCEKCDAVVPEGQSVCVMCGTAVSVAKPRNDSGQTSAEAFHVPQLVRIGPTESQSHRTRRWLTPHAVMTAFFLLVVFVCGALVMRYQEPVAIVRQVSTPTPIPPTPSATATETAVSTETSTPTLTPTITPTPAPTETPRPPRIHIVTSGETLIGLSFQYRVSPDSIAELNGFSPDAQVQVNQNLLVPWPTPTPPLEIIALNVNDSTVVLDPRDCERVEVQSGDSLVAIAARYGINFEWLAQVNRLTDPELLQPGDVVCIPDVLYDSEGVLPPTPGPSPTPTSTAPPAGPTLLYPPDAAVVTDAESAVLLQWVAVQNLADNELYMVEVVDTVDLEGTIYRAFTANTALRIPQSWRPDASQPATLRWRVAIVQVTGYRSDSVPIYTLIGQFSNPRTFVWQ